MNIKTSSIVLLILLSASTIYSQILHDFPDFKKTPGLVKSIAVNYSGIDYDAEGNPIINVDNAETVETYYKDGYKSLMKSGREYGKMDIEYIHENGNLTKVELYSYYGEKRKMWKWYQIFYKGDVISHENIFYDKDELRATINYEHSLDEDGNKLITSKMYRTDGNGASNGGFNFTYNDNNELIKKVGYTPKDTGLVSTVVGTIGDSISISEGVHQGRVDGKWAKIKSTTTTLVRKDKRGNPIYSQVKINMDKNKDGQKDSLINLTMIQHHYEDGTITGTLSQKSGIISGTYIEESELIKLTLTEDGMCSIGSIDDPNKSEVVEERLVSATDWASSLVRQSTCTYDKDLSIVKFDKIDDEIQISKIYGTLILERPGDYWDKIKLKSKN